ncbi:MULTISPECIES: hypothetical protein [unclassified Ruegeria]|uniref:hypothetical protein n=1 Tax=unclassified Ruegeria TaxID=2625375 RepID=UPI0014881664|nr:MULTISPECIES: hypothetical protein [unclassified Ruegeria]
MPNISVENAATQRGALKKNATALLGIFGPATKMRALVRLSSGRVREVTPGSRVGSGKVIAIDAEGILLQHGGETRRMVIPGA